MAGNTMDNYWKKNNFLGRFNEAGQILDKRDRLIGEVVKNLKNNDFEVLAVRKISPENGQADISYKGLEHPLVADWHSSSGWAWPTSYDLCFNYYFHSPYDGPYKNDYAFARDMDQSYLRFWFDDFTPDEVRALENACDKIRKFIKDHPEIKK